MDDGTRLPHEIDLYVTKANTGRDQDWKDQLFLESLVKKRFRERLPMCDLAEARGLLERFLDPEILAFALDNPDRRSARDGAHAPARVQSGGRPIFPATSSRPGETKNPAE